MVLSVGLTSCYKDYIEDFDYSSVFFAYQTDVRTFVVGEGMKIEVGATLAGLRSNNQNRIVNFTMDQSLVTNDILAVMKASANYMKEALVSVTALKPLPSNYFTISDKSQMNIKAGNHMGSVVIKADSAAFLSDSTTINPGYAIPFYITSADVDSINSAKRSIVVALKYENMLFGNYWHGGVTVVKDSKGQVVKTVNYFTNIPTPEIKILNLKTVAPNALVTNKISDQSGSLKLTLNGGNITVSQANGSSVKVQPDGESTYNRAKLLQDRRIYLKYKYANADGTTSYATDTLTFRNRIRDGVNEWQDENPNNYK